MGYLTNSVISVIIYAHAFDKNKREAQQKLGRVIGL